jgi:hypothetical protein
MGDNINLFYAIPAIVFISFFGGATIASIDGWHARDKCEREYNVYACTPIYMPETFVEVSP